MNLVLIGLRGSGKTAVARIVAERLGWPHFDADAEIESRAGKSIAEIFAADGEAAFRDWEVQVVADLAASDAAVIALGGGAVMRPENRAAIALRGRVVWLTASPETLWRRIEADRHSAARRPNLTPGGGITEIIATLDARGAIYRQCAHLVLDTEAKTPDQIADAILEQLDLRP
ncbi:MAG: shikimate kinase [Pirellulales bacterium]